jgi:hypothetical protein
VDQVADLAFALEEELVIGLAGQGRGDLPQVVVTTLAEKGVNPVGFGLLFGGQRERLHRGT